MWDLPGPGIEPESLALAGGFLTTGPPGKSLKIHFKNGYWMPSMSHWLRPWEHSNMKDAKSSVPWKLQRQPSGKGHSVGATDLWSSLWREYALNPGSLSEKDMGLICMWTAKLAPLQTWLGFIIFIFFYNVNLTMNLLFLRKGTKTYLNWVFIKNLGQLQCLYQA